MDFKRKPFYLNDEEISWVEETLSSMTTEEKIGQVFCITGMETDPEELKRLIEAYHPGGFMYRAGDGAEIQEAYRAMQKASRIPMLLPCNLESGGNGLTTNGTFFGKELAIAATKDPEHAYRFGLVCGREGGSVGCNWTFSPIVDLDLNWRNPITNVRTFGSDTDTVITMAREFLRGVRDAGFPMATCIKHFPGDGVDERDQHLLSTVNSLSVEEWEQTYGRIYRTLIEEGAETVMVGHILQPALTRKLCPGIKDQDIYPGSTNRYLMTELLRNELGFQGLISTDATPMVGFTGTLTRHDAILAALSGGADVILFCKNMEEDFATVRDGLTTGALSEERLNEAVARQLALKAHLKLPAKAKEGTIIPEKEALKSIGTKEHHAWAYACADEAITLVKDNQNLLPISPERTKRIRLTVLGENEGGAFGDNGRIGELFRETLEKAGFTVSVYDHATMEHGEIFNSGVEDLKAKFDLSIVAANIGTGSNNTVRRIDWITLMAADEPWYTREIPTLFVSFCNPYHMIDVPFIPTFINCYSSNPESVEAVVGKLTGKSAFKGKSPVDPWCGDVWGARFM